MNCVQSAFKLLETNTCEALTLVVIAFVLGLVAAFVVCKLACAGRACGKCVDKTPAAPQRRQQPREQRFEKTHPAPADGSIEIYVGNLSYDLTE